MSQISSDFGLIAELQGRISVVSAFAAGCCYRQAPLGEILAFVSALDNDCREDLLSPAQVHLVEISLVLKGLQAALQRVNRIRTKRKFAPISPMKRAESPIIPALECAICTEAIQPMDYLPLDTCGHMFHPACVNEYLITLITQRKFPLTCPLPTCKADISDLDLQERLTLEEYRKCDELRFSTYVQTHPNELCACPGANCTFVFERLDANPHFACPVCKENWCLTCRLPAHPLLTCPEATQLATPNGANAMLEDMAHRQGLKKCPQCMTWVEKAAGCNYIICHCGFKFCYLCGTGFKDCLCGGGFCQVCQADLQHCKCRRQERPQPRQPAVLHFQQPQPQLHYFWVQPPFGYFYRQ